MFSTAKELSTKPLLPKSNMPSSTPFLLLLLWVATHSRKLQAISLLTFCGLKIPKARIAAAIAIASKRGVRLHRPCGVEAVVAPGGGALSVLDVIG